MTIVKLPISENATRRVIGNTVASLIDNAPRLTADANGLCRLCGYDLAGGIVCCHTDEDYGMCSLREANS
jgi:hypothetical protein